MRADAVAYVDPTPTPMRANWRLRAERDVCETGPADRVRRRRRQAHAATPSGAGREGGDGQPAHDARAITESIAATSVAGNCGTDATAS